VYSERKTTARFFRYRNATITAFSQYAVQAFNLSAARYLLKPVDIEELEKAVAVVEKSIAQKEKLSSANILLENMAAVRAQHRKAVLPLMEGFEIVKLSEILYCEAEDNFTNFHLTDGRKIMVCRRLKFYESAFKDYAFHRVHRSYLVNLEYVKRYVKSEGGYVVLENEKKIMVSKTRRDDFLNGLSGQ